MAATELVLFPFLPWLSGIFKLNFSLDAVTIYLISESLPHSFVWFWSF